MTETEAAAPPIRLSADHRTAWARAYNVYRGNDLLGLVYRGSDEKWHAVGGNGRTCEGSRRTDVVRFLDEYVR